MDNELPKSSNPSKTSSSHSSEVVIAIGVFMFLAIFIVVIIIAATITRAPTTTPQPPVNQGTFLSSCTNNTCNTGLVCDGTSFTCKLGSGAACNSSGDCVSSLFCSGVCVNGPVGGLNEFCPCDTGYSCLTLPSGIDVCKGAGGTVCTTDDDCVSTLCDNGICAAGAPNAYPCSSDINCDSGNCNNGFCQDPSIITGGLGAACAGNCVGFTGAACLSTPGNPLFCDCLSGTGSPGTCVVSDLGILAACSISTLCSNVLECNNFNGSECAEGVTGCICTFPYVDPNVPTTTACIPGMKFNGTECLNATGLGCDNGIVCSTSACGGPAVLAVYNFSSLVTGNFGTNFVSAPNTSISPAVHGPTGTITPYKMFATSSGNIDTIYLVDHSQGFFSLKYNPITHTVISDWTLLLPLVTTTTTGTTVIEQTIIDVGYNGTTFLVAYSQKQTTPGGTVIFDTVYYGTSTTSLSPFNYRAGLGFTGTQYGPFGNAIPIQYIEISQANDISIGNDVMITSLNAGLLKLAADSVYTQAFIYGGPNNGGAIVGINGPVKFYFDDIENMGGTGAPVCPENGNFDPIQCPSFANTAFAGNFPSPPDPALDALQFSGNVAGAFMPLDRFDSIQYKVFDFSIYSPPVVGMPRAGVIMLCNEYTGNGDFIDTVVAVNFGGSSAILPYRVSDTSRCVATANAYYVISVGSCT